MKVAAKPDRSDALLTRKKSPFSPAKKTPKTFSRESKSTFFLMAHTFIVKIFFGKISMLRQLHEENEK